MGRCLRIMPRRGLGYEPYRPLGDQQLINITQMFAAALASRAEPRLPRAHFPKQTPAEAALLGAQVPEVSAFVW